MLAPTLRSLPRTWTSTIKLPVTKFSPRSAKPKDQDRYLKECSDDVYAWQRDARRDRSSFVLHDGPPYANGKLHIGHALNKILKDITCRFQLSQGKRIDWVPGWDCHGLPIELKALDMRRARKPTDGDGAHSIASFGALGLRTDARALAMAAIEDQKESFKSWGIAADWNNAWKTMDAGFEKKQLEVFQDMVERGLIYRQRKPVYWSPSSRTALAEAELEYKDDHVSTAAYIKFRLNEVPVSMRQPLDENREIFALVWTTTPWTLPANKAIAISESVEYVLADDVGPHHGLLILARSRVDDIQQLLGRDLKIVRRIETSELLAASYVDDIFECKPVSRPIVHADFVSAGSGTGLVHIAPGHGADDYELGRKAGLSAFAPIDDTGRFTEEAYPKFPTLLEGKDVLDDGNQAVLDIFAKQGLLLGQHQYTHKYPYDWRSKGPVILRATEQWFADVGSVKSAALEALDSVKFVPQGSKARLQSFVNNRSEWCISRQRAWGVPIPALYNTATGEALLSRDSVSHILKVITERGTDAWWGDEEFDPAWTPPLLRNEDGSTCFRRGLDTMDVWFDSGTSWTQIDKPDRISKDCVADVYLEGTDQHRGWFQSSLLTHVSCQTKEAHPRAPFKSLITHGFTLDQYGHKMSKSIGNVVSPQEIIDGSLLPMIRRKVDGKLVPDAMGVDALRLWIASSDYTKDISVSPASIKAANMALTKYRVTMKQLLGLVHEFQPSSIQGLTQFGHNHQIAIWRLKKVMESVRRHYLNFEFYKAVSEINNYINSDLSAFYLETIKDAAYCGNPLDRSIVQATCNVILYRLQQMLAPITPLLIQETWVHTPKQIQDDHKLSPFQREWNDGHDHDLALDNVEFEGEIASLMQLLVAVRNAQEQARSAKQMGSSLQSFVMLEIDGLVDQSFLSRYQQDLDTLLVASRVEICKAGEVPLHVTAAQWTYAAAFAGGTAHIYTPQCVKCVRCWRYQAPKEAKAEEALCSRCDNIVEELRHTKPHLFEGSAVAA